MSITTQVKVKVLVAQSCLTLCNPMDCHPPGSSVHENFQARILEWVAIPFSRGFSWPRDWTWVSCTAGGFFTVWATREALRTQGILHLLSDPFSRFSRSVVPNSLQPHGLQHTRLPCPSPTPEACSNSCPLSRWCHPTISSSVTPFFFFLQSFPASGSFPVSWLFQSGGKSIGASASALPKNIQDWFPLGLTGFVSHSRDSWESSQASQFKSINSSALSLLYGHPYMSTGKIIALTMWTFVSKVMSLLFNKAC